ncbi:phosphoglycerate mutase [Niveomyces insectorum RCEF 264]|uniref:Phosphoglycerate mutase n=1 Tax=Niveomyces insectorum RCEF 264 TaxID=1081102 RepID=A0A167YT40_9HYPO|nr:phosphoglycerate mutase [Niveomyces insectorum RCEF 264]
MFQIKLGFEQCQALRETLRATLPGKLDVQLVLVSPMKRTLQTAVAALDWLLDAGVPFQAHAGWQETTDHPCDVGSPLPDLAKAFPGVDFTQVDPVFPDKTSDRARAYAYNRRALVARAQSVLAELYGRPESVVLVVSHSAFLSKAVSGSMFANADFRIFSFAEPAPSAAILPLKAGEKATPVLPAAPILESPPPPPTSTMAVPPTETETETDTPAAPSGSGNADLPPLVYRLEEWDETRLKCGGMGWSLDSIREIGDGLPL